MKRAVLILADGTVYEGLSFGYEGEAGGEVVFNTSITGYQEILTDPSYSKQIVIFTNPMIGNTGINPEDIESKGLQASGLIVKEYCATPSNWRSTGSLAQYLTEHQIPAGEGFPTREIVRHIREKGAMPGILSVGDADVATLIQRAKKLESMEGKNLVDGVTCQAPYEMLPQRGKAKYFVIAYDFGIKLNIARELVKRKCRVKIVPAHTPAGDVLKERPDGILLSNGPGDPAACSTLVSNVEQLLGPIPIFGICLGHQLLSLALGAKTFKMKFGHRGANQPVKDLETGRVEITSQNHGFAVSVERLPSDMRITQINLNDETLEGFRHTHYPILSVQYHPEASPGPQDTKNIFDQFCVRMDHAKA